MNWNARWVRDASVAAVDLMVAAGAFTGAVLRQARWLAAVGGLWAVLALRQGCLAARERRQSARMPNGKPQREAPEHVS